MPAAAAILSDPGFAMREAHRAPHTTSLGPGGPATYNLASISTLARAVMIWKDQDGYGLVGG